MRGDSALDAHDLLRWLDGRGIGYGISADLGRELVAAIRALLEAAWREAGEAVQAIRHWAEIAYLPSDGWRPETGRHRRAISCSGSVRSRAGCSPTAAPRGAVQIGVTSTACVGEILTPSIGCSRGCKLGNIIVRRL